MTFVRPKKQLGQHFLNSQPVAKAIVDSLTQTETPLVEIGPGMGVLSSLLMTQKKTDQYLLIELDQESVSYLKEVYPLWTDRIVHGDFLKMEASQCFPGTFAIIGNFPYNISNQILFKVLEWKNQVTEVVGMFQKEVAERIAAKPGSRTYGILSVLLSAFYDIEYLFTVNEDVFIPPPKVKSGVIKLIRNDVSHLDCDEAYFIRVVKTAFNQRRKTLRNSLKPLGNIDACTEIQHLLPKRAEQLSVADFVLLTQNIASL